MQETSLYSFNIVNWPAPYTVKPCCGSMLALDEHRVNIDNLYSLQAGYPFSHSRGGYPLRVSLVEAHL